ncbi:hypothetical protein ACM66B_002990 [Microbotryomycetes sp. NB124-2]
MAGANTQVRLPPVHIPAEDEPQQQSNDPAVRRRIRQGSGHPPTSTTRCNAPIMANDDGSTHLYKLT